MAKNRYNSIFQDLRPGDQVGGYHVYSTTFIKTQSGLQALLFIVHNNGGINWEKGTGFKALYHKEPFRGALREIKLAETKSSLRVSTSLALSKIKKL